MSFGAFFTFCLSIVLFRSIRHSNSWMFVDPPNDIYENCFFLSNFCFFLFRFFYVIKTHFLFKISFSCVVEWKMRSFLFNFKFKSKSTHKQRAKRNQKLAHSLQSVVIRQFYCASWILKYENVSNGVDKTTKYTRR